jgi:hypothetical protein
MRMLTSCGDNGSVLLWGWRRNSFNDGLNYGDSGADFKCNVDDGWCTRGTAIDENLKYYD